MNFIKMHRAILDSLSKYCDSRLIIRKRHIHKLNFEGKVNDNSKNIKVSTLYVPGRYGGNVYQIVKPSIDLNYIEKNLKVIEQSCHVRKIELDLHLLLKNLKEWTIKQDEYQKILQETHDLQAEEKRLKSLNFEKEAGEIKKSIDSKIGYLKSVKENLHDIEDILMPLVQKIPNIIDPETPVNESLIKIHREPRICDIKSCSHLEIGNTLSILEFLNTKPNIYYLKGPLAKLELLAQDYFSKKLQEAGFAPLSCVDFCKSFILEAAGSDPHSHDQCIQLKDGKVSDIGQKFNLIGGASFESFLVYLTNMNTASVTLPAKYFCIGRHYNAANRSNPVPSLFSVIQSCRVHCVVLSRPFQESIEFKMLLDMLLSCYLPLEIPFRSVDVSAQFLNSTESRRIQLELWSPAKLEFVPVAYVSQRNDMISKRLQITYGEEFFVEGYCCIVESSVVNVPVLLGCIIENNVKTKSVNFEEIFTLFNT